MQLIQADCEIHYSGRGDTYLERGIRLIVIKSDGSVAIHQDKGVKPLNYMGKSSSIDISERKDPMLMHIESKNEFIDIIIYDIVFETFLDFDEGSDLIRKGTEKQVQAWLAQEENFKETFGNHMSFIAREYQTTKGPCDLLGYNERNHQIVLIEVKRYAKRNDTYQLIRYRTAMRELYDNAIANGDTEIVSSTSGNVVPLPTEWCKNPECILAAPKFKRGTEQEAHKQGIETSYIAFDPDDPEVCG